MDVVRKIKKMQSQLNKLEAEKAALELEVKTKQKEVSAKATSIKLLKKEIAKHRNTEEIKVSEHAIVRYFERVKGYDIEAIKKEIVNEELQRLVKTLGGSGQFPNGTMRVVMKNYTITTVIK